MANGQGRGGAMEFLPAQQTGDMVGNVLQYKQGMAQLRTQQKMQRREQDAAKAMAEMNEKLLREVMDRGERIYRGDAAFRKGAMETHYAAYDKALALSKKFSMLQTLLGAAGVFAGAEQNEALMREVTRTFRAKRDAAKMKHQIPTIAGDSLVQDWDRGASAGIEEPGWLARKWDWIYGLFGAETIEQVEQDAKAAGAVKWILTRGVELFPTLMADLKKGSFDLSTPLDSPARRQEFVDFMAFINAAKAKAAEDPAWGKAFLPAVSGLEQKALRVYGGPDGTQLPDWQKYLAQSNLDELALSLDGKTGSQSKALIQYAIDMILSDPDLAAGFEGFFPNWNAIRGAPRTPPPGTPPPRTPPPASRPEKPGEDRIIGPAPAPARAVTQTGAPSKEIPVRTAEGWVQRPGEQREQIREQYW